MSFFKSKQFFLGLAILVGIGVGAMAKLGVFQNLTRQTLVSADQTVKPQPVSENPDKPNPSPRTVEGYTVIDKDTPIYVVETEENNNIKCAAGHYVNNQRMGLWEFYYPNGTTKATGDYKSNQKDGMWKYYYASGQLMSAGRYANGVMTGTWITYYVNGNRKSEGQCEGRLQVGPWIQFPDENRPDRYWQGSFNAAGNMEGQWKYFENRAAVRTVTYSNGNVVQ